MEGEYWRLAERCVAVQGSYFTDDLTKKIQTPLTAATSRETLTVMVKLSMYPAQNN